MSHFLNHLVTRSLHTPEHSHHQVQPRLPSMFEPVSFPPATVPLSDLFVGTVAAAEQMDESEGRADPSGASPASSGRPRSREESIGQAMDPDRKRRPLSAAQGFEPMPEVQASRQPFPVAGEPGQRPPEFDSGLPQAAQEPEIPFADPGRSPTPPAIPPPLVSPLRRVSEALSPLQPTPPVQSPNAPPDSGSTTPRLNPVSPALPQAFPAPEPVVLELELPPSQPGPSGPPSGMAPVKEARPAIAPDSRPPSPESAGWPPSLLPASASPPGRMTPAIYPRPVEARAHPGELASVEAAPSIHITIGRIEVRATPPSPPPKRPQATPQPPALGLDEYLRLRSRGGR